MEDVLINPFTHSAKKFPLSLQGSTCLDTKIFVSKRRNFVSKIHQLRIRNEDMFVSKAWSQTENENEIGFRSR